MAENLAGTVTTVTDASSTGGTSGTSSSGSSSGGDGTQNVNETPELQAQRLAAAGRWSEIIDIPGISPSWITAAKTEVERQTGMAPQAEVTTGVSAAPTTPEQLDTPTVEVAAQAAVPLPQRSISTTELSNDIIETMGNRAAEAVVARDGMFATKADIDGSRNTVETRLRTNLVNPTDGNELTGNSSIQKAASNLSQQAMKIVDDLRADAAITGNGMALGISYAGGTPTGNFSLLGGVVPAAAQVATAPTTSTPGLPD